MRARTLGAALVGICLLLVAAGCYVGPNEPPTAHLTASWSTAHGFPIEVTLSACRSTDPDGWIRVFRWDFGDQTGGDGPCVVNHTYHEPGRYTIGLLVVDNRGDVDFVQMWLMLPGPGEPMDRRST